MTGTADPASDPDAFAQLVVRLAESSSVTDDRITAANRTSSRQAFQRHYPGSSLSFVSGSAIKKITAGVKAHR
jgi:hypothetical protein